MRCAIVRAWIALATALLAAALADAATECAENLGWLGGSVRDGQQQAIEPTLLLGMVVAVSLAVFVAFVRIAPQDPLLRLAGGLRERAIDLTLAFAGSALFTVVMEGYETRFGGVSPFDPRSVVLSHTLPLLIAFVVVAAAIHCGLRLALRVATQAGRLAAEVLVEFLLRIARAAVAPGAVRASVFALLVPHLPAAMAAGARGLRSPPRSTLHRIFAIGRSNRCEVLGARSAPPSPLPFFLVRLHTLPS